jgi:hypothetical protein
VGVEQTCLAFNCSWLLFPAALLLSSLPSIVGLKATAISFPAPEGPYSSSIKVQVLTDTSRLNPFNGSSRYRQVVVSYYEPYLKTDCANIGEIDYMPAKVAEWFNENDLPRPSLTTFSQIKVSGVGLQPTITTPSNLPLLIWTGGFYTSRLQYGAIV